MARPPRAESGILVDASRDGGLTWDTSVPAINHINSVTPFEDKPGIVVDNASETDIGPEVRASLPTTTRDPRFPLPPSPPPLPALAHVPNAAAQRATTSGVRSVPTRPRTPDTLTISVSDMAYARRASIARVGRRSGCSWGVGMGSVVPSANARRKALTISGSNCTPFPSSSSRIACWTEREGR